MTERTDTVCILHYFLSYKKHLQKTSLDKFFLTLLFRNCLYSVAGFIGSQIIFLAECIHEEDSVVQILVQVDVDQLQNHCLSYHQTVFLDFQVQMHIFFWQANHFLCPFLGSHTNRASWEAMDEPPLNQGDVGLFQLYKLKTETVSLAKFQPIFIQLFRESLSEKMCTR